MGQQQLLFIIIGVVIVGIAISVAISMFTAQSVESSRNAVLNDLGYFAQRAREYYWKPKGAGGGGNSFEGVNLHILASQTTTPNGRYYVEQASTAEVILMGVGNVLAGEDSIRIRMRVNEKENIIEIIN